MIGRALPAGVPGDRAAAPGEDERGAADQGLGAVCACDGPEISAKSGPAA